MGKKVSISLVISTEMSERDENSVVRLPKKSREHLGLDRGKVILGKGFYQIEASVKAAYSSDLRRLVAMLKTGKVREEDAPLIGFVSRSTYQKVSAKPGDNVWLSDGLGSITVGCDPEFGLVQGKLLLRADMILPGSKKKHFGEDGPGAEVRPNPSQNHLEVVKNILAILKAAPKEVEQYKWVGGATFKDSERVYWFGGHIHFGRPKELPVDRAPFFFQNIAWALDYFTAWPMLAFDTPEPHLRRDGCVHKYGHAGDIRTKDGNSRFEYRVLSGLWLTHPTLAKIVMGTAKAVVEHVYNKAASHDFASDYALDVGGTNYKSPLIKDLGLPGMPQISKEINKGVVKPMPPLKLSHWAEKLRALETYGDYHREVDALIAIVEASPAEIVQHLDLDIRKNWLEGKPLLEQSTPQVKAAIQAVEERS